MATDGWLATCACKCPPWSCARGDIYPFGIVPTTLRTDPNPVAQNCFPWLFCARNRNLRTCRGSCRRLYKPADSPNMQLYSRQESTAGSPRPCGLRRGGPRRTHEFGQGRRLRHDARDVNAHADAGPWDCRARPTRRGACAGDLPYGAQLFGCRLCGALVTRRLVSLLGALVGAAASPECSQPGRRLLRHRWRRKRRWLR